jgi:predicted transcriptional regulator
MSTTPLPDAEADVLAALYELGDGTARDVREHLERRRPMAHASVATLLGRLEDRGLIRRRKGDSGKAFIYSPTTARPRAFAGSLKRALDVVERGFGGSSVALIASLFETRRPTADELQALRQLVKQYDEKK